MIIKLNSGDVVSRYLEKYRTSTSTIGFVPTMGYLHSGHLSLVKKSLQSSHATVVTIFVNPSQFGKDEDFGQYPRDTQRDIDLLSSMGDVGIYIPTMEEMYSPNHKTWIEVSALSNRLCGHSRKGHFRGVTTIVAKFLNIIQPDKMFMGEKDFQQLVILEKMVADLSYQTKIVRCPTIREQNGLAMSSRNKYLNSVEKEQAASIYQSLQQAVAKYKRQNVLSRKMIIDDLVSHIELHGGKIDYADVVDSQSLQPAEKVGPNCRILVAAFFGDTRLIDNIGFD